MILQDQPQVWSPRDFLVSSCDRLTFYGKLIIFNIELAWSQPNVAAPDCAGVLLNAAELLK